MGMVGRGRRRVRRAAGLVTLVGVVALLLVAAAPVAADPTDISVNSVTVTEGTGATVDATFKITLDAPATAELTANYATADGTAKQPADYAAQGGALTFAVGEFEKTVVVPVAGDDLDEPTETFNLNVTSSLGNRVGTGTIEDDDPTPTVSINDPGFPEVPGTGNFLVSLSSKSSQAVQVVWVPAGGTASNPADYEFPPQNSTLTFDPGQTTKQIAVQIKGDTVIEGDETILVNLTSASGGATTIAKAQGTGVIVDNDGTAPVMSFDPKSITITEGGGSLLTVKLSSASSQVVTASVNSANGTANASADYTPISSGIVQFNPGEVVKTVPVSAASDQIDEDAETFTVTLSAPSNATIDPGAGTATVTIADNNPEPQVSISGPTTVTEPASGTTTLTFNVSVTPQSGRTVTVNYGTLDGTATAGSDFNATDGSLSFAPGDPPKPFTVTILGDTTNEPNETFSVGLSGAVNGTVSGGPVQVTIVDANAPPTLGISDGTVGEADRTIVLDVTLAGSTAQTVTVQYEGQTGSNFPGATLGTDFTLAPGTLTFEPGETKKTITVTIVDDTAGESDETFSVLLKSPTPAGVTLAKARATVKIVDNDAGAAPPPPPPSTTTRTNPPPPPANLPPTTTTPLPKVKPFLARVLWTKLDGKVNGRKRAAIRVTLNKRVSARLLFKQGKRIVRSSPFELRAGNRTVYVLLPKNVKKGRVDFQLLFTTAASQQKVLKTKLLLKA